MIPLAKMCPLQHIMHDHLIEMKVFWIFIDPFSKNARLGFSAKLPHL